MESSFLLERKIISMCFNPLRETVFILSAEMDKLDLTEEDISKNIILRRFKLLKLNECNIINSEYRKLPKDTYEGYGIYFWELAKKIIVIYPIGYLLIFDYQTSQLNYHFQCQGRKAYVIRNIIGSPIQHSLFLSAEKMRNIYHINYQNIKNGISYQKLVIPQNEAVFDLCCHPHEKFIFAACSDSLVRIFDYSNIGNKIVEVKNGLVDVMIGKDNKPLKNQSEIIKKNNLLSVISIDINNTGTYLLSGNENGYVYLWDALLAIKNRRLLFCKEKFSATGIVSLRFITTKQFVNLNRFICLTKEGKFYICNIIMKEENGTKFYNFNKLYENSIFNPIVNQINKYNVMTSNFVNISYHNNMICLKWPTLRFDKIQNGEKKEDCLLFTNFSAKFFFIYDNLFPKINFAIATQMSYKNYEDYIPISNKNNLVFERKIFVVDNFFIYFYDVMTGNIKKIINYMREFNLKAIYPLKFQVKELDNSLTSEVYFVILIENENYQKCVLMIHYDMSMNVVKLAQKFDDVIDFSILGNEESKAFNYIFLLHKNKLQGLLYNVENKTKDSKNIETSVSRIYLTPFAQGHCILYRNILNELKFSSNLRSSDLFDFKCSNENSFRLDYSEREIDVCWKKIDNKYLCAISMIEKIVITDEEMKILYSLKSGLLENPNIISSLFWIGKTLFYSKGSSIHYFYGEDNINQKIFSCGQPNMNISGILADRYILVSKSSDKNVLDVNVTTPMLNPIEPVLIGYLDSQSIDYNILKEAIVNLFSNQLSQNLIDKLLKRDLKEVAWLLLSDNKSSFQNIEKKVSILNDLLKFDMCLDVIIPNKNLKNEMDLDELLWRFTYDHSIEYLKNILISQCNTLINYGQFDYAIKICELLCDYPKAINLLLISSNKEEYEKLKIVLRARGCLSYTDLILTNNIFHVMKTKHNNLDDNYLKNYNKIFDNYKGEPFIFGANQDKFKILTIKDAINKINKKNSHINSIQKKILSYGETPFSQFTRLYNKETSQYELVNICTLLLQKIDQYYGHKNTIYENNLNRTKKVDFSDYSVSLSNIKDSDKNEEEEDSIDANLEEINENLYLTAYFHCEKGNGNVLEDITENNSSATLIMNNPPIINEIAISQNQLADDVRMEENLLWTQMLEEFEPLEYEDKWGRKSPGSHAIKFSSIYGVNMRIKHTSNFNHFHKKFTIEFWLKIFTNNSSLLSKDGLVINIQNGSFIAFNDNKQLNPVKTSDYQIPLDKWIHLAICYRKKTGKLKIFMNCDDILYFSANLPEESRGDIKIGNCTLDGELTEIRIWSQEIPIKFLKENFKSPLPILAESKRKLRMKINKQEENSGNNKVEVNKSTNRFQSFAFGQNKSNPSTSSIPPKRNTVLSPPSNTYLSNNNFSTTPKPITQLNNQMIIEEPETIDLNPVSKFGNQNNINIEKANNNENFYEFNPPPYIPDMNEVSYPSKNSVLGQEKDNLPYPRFDNEINYDFKFDDINNQKYNFEFNKDEFNFK